MALHRRLAYCRKQVVKIYYMARLKFYAQPKMKFLKAFWFAQNAPVGQAIKCPMEYSCRPRKKTESENICI